MLGRSAEPISPAHPPPERLRRLVFPEPIGTPEDIARAAGRLAHELAGDLARAGLAARRLEFTLYLAAGGIERIAVGCARPSRDPAHLCAAGFGADVVTLAATATERLAAEQVDFQRLAPVGEGAAALDRGPGLSLLIDRLGHSNLLRAAPCESHLPERAVRVVVPLSPLQGGGWDKGPERLAPEWWRPASTGGRTRDYYRLEDEAGARFWIYRDGLYTPPAGEPDEAPRWYLHEFFA